MCRATTARTSSAVMPRAVATRATWYSAAAGLMSGSSPEAEVVIEVDRDRAVAVRPRMSVDGRGDPVDERLARRARGSSLPSDVAS